MASTSTCWASATPRTTEPLTLIELEVRIRHWARNLGLETSFFQTNSEAEYVERLHQAPELADALILNPGAWTHYSYAIRDALEIAGLPAVEVHLSDVDAREEWRRHSVIDDLAAARISGKGPDGYREALELIADRLGVEPPDGGMTAFEHRAQQLCAPAGGEARSTCCWSPTWSTFATCAASPAPTASAWSVPISAPS